MAGPLTTLVDPRVHATEITPPCGDLARCHFGAAAARRRSTELGHFEPALPEIIDVTMFAREDADLVAALMLHGLQLE
jgi:hypothetical protein